jgi:hypothetical protein
MAEKRYTLEETHLVFAKQLNGAVWDLLDKPDRSAAEDELMLHAAHASCYHWLQAGTPLHHQRGEWLIARTYAVLGRGTEALRHAQRCMEITLEHPDLMEDFDTPFAYECMARAHAVLGNHAEALDYFRLAESGGERIADAEDRKIFFESLRGGEWHGVARLD